MRWLVPNPDGQEHEALTPRGLVEWLVAMDAPDSSTRRTVTLTKIIDAAKEALAACEEPLCPCGEPAPKGWAPCTFEKPCPYGTGLPRERWLAAREEPTTPDLTRMQVITGQTSEADARAWVGRLERERDAALDALDREEQDSRRLASLADAAYEELQYAKTHEYESPALAAIAAREEPPDCCRYHHFNNTNIPEWNALTQEARTAIVVTRCDGEHIIERIDGAKVRDVIEAVRDRLSCQGVPTRDRAIWKAVEAALATHEDGHPS
jgi:hypothetical protein